jgi:hypothetical protein
MRRRKQIKIKVEVEKKGIAGRWRLVTLLPFVIPTQEGANQARKRNKQADEVSG